MKGKFQLFGGFKKLRKLKENPERIAKSFALGSFIGMLPIPGFQALVSLTLASIFKLYRPAAIIGVFNTNVATGGFVFAFNYWLGKTILGVSPDFQFPDKIDLSFFQSIWHAGEEVFLSMLTGGLITGVFAALLAYRLALLMLQRKTDVTVSQT